MVGVRLVALDGARPFYGREELHFFQKGFIKEVELIEVSIDFYPFIFKFCLNQPC